MKVARLHGPGDIRLSDEPLPVPGDGEVVVCVTAVGICGAPTPAHAPALHPAPGQLDALAPPDMARKAVDVGVAKARLDARYRQRTGNRAPRRRSA